MLFRSRDCAGAGGGGAGAATASEALAEVGEARSGASRVEVRRTRPVARRVQMEMLDLSRKHSYHEYGHWYSNIKLRCHSNPSCLQKIITKNLLFPPR